MTTISMISAAYTQAFLDAFASLGIEPWAGTECHRAQFLCIECAQLSGTTHPPECRSCRMQISPLTSFSVPLQDSIQTCEILGLMEGGSCVPLMPPVGIQGIGVLLHPCYILIQADDYWVFNHRPHGLLELVLGSRSVLPMCPTSDDQLPSSPSFSVATPSSWAIVPLASDVAQWGRGGPSAGQLLQWLLYTGRCGSEQHSHGEYQTCRPIDHPTAAHRPNGAD